MLEFTVLLVFLIATVIASITAFVYNIMWLGAMLTIVALCMSINLQELAAKIDEWRN